SSVPQNGQNLTGFENHPVERCMGTTATFNKRMPSSSLNMEFFPACMACRKSSQHLPKRGASGVISRRLGGELLALLDRLLDRADHVEGRLRQVVVLAFAQALEAADRVGEFDEYAGEAGEHFGDVHGLREESLDLARARHGKLVLFGELVHAENRDDVL